MSYSFCDTVDAHVRNNYWSPSVAELTEHSHREAVPSPAVVSEPTYLNTLRRRITLYTGRHQRVGQKVGRAVDVRHHYR